MLPISTPDSGSPAAAPTATEALAALIVAELGAAGLLTAPGETVATRLLTTGNVRPGEWLQLLAADDTSSSPPNSHAASSRPA